MDRATHHRPVTQSNRAHEHTSFSKYVLLLEAVEATHTGPVQSTQDTQKYMKWAVCGTEPTDTHADGHVPVTPVPHPPRIHCLRVSVRLGRQHPSIFTSTSSKGSCAPSRTSAATTQPVLRSQCLESSHAHSTAERTGRSQCALQASRQPCAPSRHRRRRHSASPHARMRRWRVRRAKAAKTLLAQSPPLDSRVGGRALVRRRAAHSGAGPPQVRQSGCHGQRPPSVHTCRRTNGGPRVGLQQERTRSQVAPKHWSSDTGTPKGGSVESRQDKHRGEARITHTYARPAIRTRAHTHTMHSPRRAQTVLSCCKVTRNEKCKGFYTLCSLMRVPGCRRGSRDGSMLVPDHLKKEGLG